MGWRQLFKWKPELVQVSTSSLPFKISLPVEIGLGSEHLTSELLIMCDYIPAAKKGQQEDIHFQTLMQWKGAINLPKISCWKQNKKKQYHQKTSHPRHYYFFNWGEAAIFLKYFSNTKQWSKLLFYSNVSKTMYSKQMKKRKKQKYPSNILYLPSSFIKNAKIVQSPPSFQC